MFVKHEVATMQVYVEVTTKPSIFGVSSVFVGKNLALGDIVLDLTKLNIQTPKMGSSLHEDYDNVTVKKVGILRYTIPKKYWVEE